MNNSYSVNKIILVGNILKDGRYQQNDQPHVFFSMVTENTVVKNGGETVTQEYHNVKVPGRIAGNGNLFLKDRLIFLEGTIKTRSFNDTAGIKHYRTEIWVNHYQFLN